MMYHGPFFKLNQLPTQNNIVELVFDSEQDSVNTLRKEALIDLEKTLKLLENENIAGLIIRSDKRLFSAGADIKSFRQLFADGANAVQSYLEWVHSIYNRIEDLPYPKVAIINGVAAGGGVELSLLADYRLATSDAKISMPEVKLGIFPGWGGVTRLPRIIGLDMALSWLTTGKNFKAPEALKAHMVDGIVDDSLNAVDQAVALLNSAISGEVKWQERHDEKQQPLPLNNYELSMSLNVARGMVAKSVGTNYPAPFHILDTIGKSAYLQRDAALEIEAEGFVACTQSPVTDALVTVYLNDMAVKSISKNYVKNAPKTEHVGVIGAGIMGGGIAYVSSESNLDVTLKDINKAGLDLGLKEANKLLTKQVEKGRMKPNDMGNVLNRIVPTLYNQALENTDLIIEAVVENPQVKEKVLAELESAAPNAVIASNTSTLNISGLAKALKKPENFCGIHFFNPVHRMPLVEIIRGEHTSEATVAKAVNYVLQLRKTPIVVNDCAGFLVNRCLTPYFLAFNQLLVDGGSISQIDKVMSKGFGWPMGPALLLDVIGLDTTTHCIDVMSKAFPERQAKPEINIIEQLNDKGHLGQKSGQGFYLHTPDRKGRLKPSACRETLDMLAQQCENVDDFSEEDIQLRMMLPMLFEVTRCLDEGIVNSPQEADTAFLYGTGFPPFKGGLFYYMDSYGLDTLVAKAKKYEHLGPLYQIPQGLITRAEQNRRFYA